MTDGPATVSEPAALIGVTVAAIVQHLQVRMWVRATSCLRRIDERWRIVHEHSSVPFDAVTGEALVTGEL